MYQQLPPSCNQDVRWLKARNFSGWNDAGPNKGYQGKWMIFSAIEDVDEDWAIIEEATEGGELGYMSSVRTCQYDYNNPHFNDGDRVICVFTYYERDEQDVFRVRDQLRDLGFQGELGYKTYKATFQRRFRYKGNRNICKYWC